MTEDIDRIRTAFSEQLKRKDEEIERLKKENRVLIATALKQSEKNKELLEKLEKAAKIK
ncbi:hypothetical protein JXA85_00120 [Candidatus Woesearchaeota archaeon]|nr:hypothetical protein [Candidatus Woesearchaeota archaeon]